MEWYGTFLRALADFLHGIGPEAQPLVGMACIIGFFVAWVIVAHVAKSGKVALCVLLPGFWVATVGAFLVFDAL